MNVFLNCGCSFLESEHQKLESKYLIKNSNSKQIVCTYVQNTVHKDEATCHLI